MGYRGIFIVPSLPIDIPTWFIDKYSERYSIDVSARTIVSKGELKRHLDSIEEDVHSIISSANLGFDLWAFWLYEDGAITRIRFKCEYESEPFTETEDHFKSPADLE
jgi:hypothetical protein